jgi:hypothetical protein
MQRQIHTISCGLVVSYHYRWVRSVKIGFSAANKGWVVNRELSMVDRVG